MFTPPPSPLPGAAFDHPPASIAPSTSKDSLLTPPCSPPEKSGFSLPTPSAAAEGKSTAEPPQQNQQEEKKKRKRYLPVLLAAIVLAIIAVSARPATLHAVSFPAEWFAAPIPAPAPIPTSAPGLPETVGLESAEAADAHDRARQQARRHHSLAARQSGTPTTATGAGVTLGSGTQTLNTATASSPTGSNSNPLDSPTALLPVYTAPPSVPSPALPVPTPFPAPFDMALSFNITTPACVNFFNTFIQNTTFRACRPFGMLMSSSQQFQAAQSNLTVLTSIVGGTCATDQTADACGAVMDWHAEQISLSQNCGADIQAGEALAVTALEGFRAYRMMRLAGCLINPVTAAYCYVEAAASLLPNDLYFWVASLGIPLPNATQPTCSSCTQSLLSTYAQFVGDSGLLVGKVYTDAANRARAACGAGYASDVAVASGAVPRQDRGLLLSSVVAACLGVVALLLQVL